MYAYAKGHVRMRVVMCLRGDRVGGVWGVRREGCGVWGAGCVVWGVRGVACGGALATVCKPPTTSSKSSTPNSTSTMVPQSKRVCCESLLSASKREHRTSQGRLNAKHRYSPRLPLGDDEVLLG